MIKNLGPHWALSVWAFLSLSMIPIPFLLYRYGHILRQRSRFPTSHAGRARPPFEKYARKQEIEEVEAGSAYVDSREKKEPEA
jgi:hypothetical protein